MFWLCFRRTWRRPNTCAECGWRGTSFTKLTTAVCKLKCVCFLSCVFVIDAQIYSLLQIMVICLLFPLKTICNVVTKHSVIMGLDLVVGCITGIHYMCNKMKPFHNLAINSNKSYGSLRLSVFVSSLKGCIYLIKKTIIYYYNFK